MPKDTNTTTKRVGDPGGFRVLTPKQVEVRRKHQATLVEKAAERPRGS